MAHLVHAGKCFRAKKTTESPVTIGAERAAAVRACGTSVMAHTLDRPICTAAAASEAAAVPATPPAAAAVKLPGLAGISWASWAAVRLKPRSAMHSDGPAQQAPDKHGADESDSDVTHAQTYGHV
jgi:hypothetical protein